MDRFGQALSDSSGAQASRLLSETVDAGLIALYDESVGYRNRQYVPFWAAA